MRKCARGICFCALSLLLAATLLAQKAAPHARSAEQPITLTQAEAAIDRQQWPAAETLLRKLVAANPKNALAWFDLGYVMHAQKNYAEAIVAYRGAVAAEPENFECNLNLGMTLAHEGQPDARKYLEKSTHLKPAGARPQESLAHAWIALAELDAGDSKRALDEWEHAVKLSPDLQTRLAYGEALEKAGDTAGAEREYSEASRAKPDSAEALAALANLYMHGRRLPEAEETLLRLVSITPQNESAHLQLGRILRAEKKDDAASEELQKALALKPDDWDAMRELALVEERARQWTAAEEHYRRLLTHFPDDADLHNGLGVVLLPQLKYAAARDEFLRCTKLRPQWGEAYGQLALAASGNKEYELAIKALEERKKLLPEVPYSYFLRATCYDHLRRFAEAVENYKAFLAVSKGESPDDEWKARHRLIAIEPEARKKK